MEQGAALKRSLVGATGGYLNGLCDSIDKCNVTNVNAAKNLSNSESGNIILGVVGTAQAAGTGFNINLPAPERGLWFKITLGAPSIANNSNAAITVTATSDGSTATAGDHAELVSDGTNWFVNAVGDAAGSVTLA